MNDQAARVEQLTKQFTDEGRIIEAGWQVFRLLVVPPNASIAQVTEMRKAFFAGSQHLFGSILSVLDEGDELTPNDLQRLQLLVDQLHAFEEELRREIAGPGRR